jgi:hypothetical protein
LHRLAELAEQGLPILFVGGLPTRTIDLPAADGSRDASDALRRLAAASGVQAVPLHELARQIRAMGLAEIEAEGDLPYLTCYHVKHLDLDVFMFFNEHPYDSLETTVRIPATGRTVLYDAFANRISESGALQRSGGVSLPLQLSPYESVLVLAGRVDAASLPADVGAEARYGVGLGSAGKTPLKALSIKGPWSVSTATSEQYPRFEALDKVTNLSDMSRPDALPSFSGTFRYETEFDWPHAEGTAWLDLGQAYETVEVWVNGQPAGVRICPPYRLDVGRLLCPGLNRLVIEVTNTLVNEQRDFFSCFAQQEPSGQQGPVRLLYGKEGR